MKNSIKRLIPLWLLSWYRARKQARSIFFNKTATEVFTEIYNTNYWGSLESVSGSGSELKQTESLIKDLDVLLKNMNVKSVLDIPCGDFNWMQRVDLATIDYIGADIVEKLISDNIRKYKEERGRSFIVLNLITDPLPKSDIIIVRDCFVHLSSNDIAFAIKNIKASGSEYLLTTTFTNCGHNNDILTGGWRPINLQIEPFNFPSPLLTINENCSENNGKYKDKSMALWDISKI